MIFPIHKIVKKLKVLLLYAYIEETLEYRDI